MSLASISIDLSALRHNLAVVREAAPGRKVLAVIKANAYGHGMLDCARALASAEGFAVARLEEALLLRQSFPQHFILVMGVEPSPGNWLTCSQWRLAPIIHSREMALSLASQALPQPIPAWLKVDTGMHRLGVSPGECHDIFHLLRNAGSVETVTLMTHLACADETHNPFTAQQLELFSQSRRGLDAPASIANSAGILAWPDTLSEWVRPGIMLYGHDPLDRSNAWSERLRPVMTLESVLLAIREIDTGDAVGYNATWKASRPSRIGTVAIGYGDGYPRSACEGTPLWIRDRKVPLVGRVSMDLVTVDLTDHPAAQPGDRVELWGAHIPLNEVAQHSGTISYELTTRLTARPSRTVTA